MEYIVFTMIVAAGGAIVFWFWLRSYRAGLKYRLGQARQAANGLPEPSIPPFKRTICGPSEAELTQLEFQRRIDEWQKNHPVLGFRYNSRLEQLQGDKYTFVPRTRNGERISSSA